MGELEALNLKHYIPEATKNIAMNKFGARDQQLIVEICVLVHQRYESFAQGLMTELEKQFKLTPITEFNKKRNILRTLTELYFKGLASEYQGIFKCLVNIILINYEETEDEFQKAMHIVTDYMKTYGEQIF